MASTANIDNYQMDQTISNDVEKNIKSVRNFTDLPAPFFSKRGSLIQHEIHSEHADRNGNRISLQSVVSGESIILEPEGNTIDNFQEIDDLPLGRMYSAASKVSQSQDPVFYSSRGSVDITRESSQEKLGQRNLLPTAGDVPSTPSDFSHFTKESVDDESDKSSISEPPMDLETSRKVLKKWILLSLVILVIYGAFSVAYQIYQSLYTARDGLNDKAIPSNQSLSEIDSYVTAHPENRIGLWQECNDFGCRDLPLYCAADEIKQRLLDSGLVRFASQEQTNDFVQNQLHICPMIKVSRFTSVFSVFAAVIALIGLVMTLLSNQKILFTFVKLGGLLMVLLTTITFALFIAIKEILDHLVSLAANYSETGSSTAFANVDTSYAYSVSFWICCLSFITSIILFALFLMLSKSADKLRQHEKDDYRKSDAYSISTLESVDVGPRVDTVRSQDSTIRFNDSIHNLTQSPTLEYIESFEAPPMADSSKTVRFS